MGAGIPRKRIQHSCRTDSSSVKPVIQPWIRWRTVLVTGSRVQGWGRGEALDCICRDCSCLSWEKRAPHIAEDIIRKKGALIQ